MKMPPASPRLILAAGALLLTAALQAQDFYVSDSSGIIHKVSAAGAVSNFATLPLNSDPVGLAVDGGGFLFEAEGILNAIRKISPDGLSVSTFASVPAPSRLAVDSNNNLYASNSGASQISKITAGGVVSTFATLPANSFPIGLAFDASGNLYAADYLTNQISKIAPNGTVSVFATLAGNSRPQDLAFDASGYLYVVNYLGETISKISPDGLTVSPFAGMPSPYELTFDGSGNLYVLRVGGQITKFSPNGNQGPTILSGLSSARDIVLAPPSAPVPEPSVAVSLALGCASLLGRRRRRSVEVV